MYWLKLILTETALEVFFIKGVLSYRWKRLSRKLCVYYNMLYSHSISSFTVKEAGYLDNSGVAKKTAEDILKFAQKKEQLTREVLSTVETR